MHFGDGGVGQMSALAAVGNGVAPWVAALTGDPNYELMVLGWLAAFFLSHNLITRSLDRKPHWSPLKRELIKRPTVLPVTLHSLVTTVAAAIMLSPPALVDGLEPSGVQLWRRGVLPFSTAYWLFDLYNYCIPKRDMLIAAHHLIIVCCNYPVGDSAGLAVASAQLPSCNFVMMSTNGYVLELTTFLLYIRWYLTFVLQGHHWVYTLNNVVLLASWVGLRLLYTPYFMVTHLWATCPVFEQGGLLPLAALAAYALMIVMSAVWLLQMLKHGVTAFLVLKKGGSAGAVPAFGSQVHVQDQDEEQRREE